MLRSIPSPTSSALEIGPLTIHYYALCIITGIAVAIWLGDKRFRAVAPQALSVVSEVAITAAPIGIIGGRIYHVISSPDSYFGKEGNPLDAFKIWQGGLGIWGAIALGTFGAWLRYRMLAKKIELPSFAYFMDALAPGVLLAQGIGRFGNWFNIELFGRPLQGPWALEVPLVNRPHGFTEFSTFHPTFLYEAIWSTVLAFLLIKFGTSFRPGQVFALYVFGYCIGRIPIEMIRIDQAHLILGARLNVWVGIIVATGALIIFRRLNKESGDTLR
ncbi:MAG: prolipoprotein diacylglyceryl transferase [Actinomycetota bacterium]|nr:prolipoprotein diacylglyceryl transferase [Actinomycetota bacterium]